MKATARLLTCGLGAGALLSLALSTPALAEAPPLPALKPGPSLAAAELRTRLVFAPAEAELDAAARLALTEIAEQMRAAPGGQLSITAYAAAPGGDEALARRLSLGRAIAVRRFLIDEGVSDTRMAVRALVSRTGSSSADRVDLRLPAQ